MPNQALKCLILRLFFRVGMGVWAIAFSLSRSLHFVKLVPITQSNILYSSIFRPRFAPLYLTFHSVLWSPSLIQWNGTTKSLPQCHGAWKSERWLVLPRYEHSWPDHEGAATSQGLPEMWFPKEPVNKESVRIRNKKTAFPDWMLTSLRS